MALVTMYGVVNDKLEYSDASNSLHGAKVYATRNGYDHVGFRAGYNITREWKKKEGAWEEIREEVMHEDE